MCLIEIHGYKQQEIQITPCNKGRQVDLKQSAHQSNKQVMRPQKLHTVLHLTGLSIQHPSIKLIPKHIPKHKNHSIQIYSKIFEYLEEALDSLISRLGRTLKCLT